MKENDKLDSNSKNLNIVSNHENLRLCIIENCIFIEQIISQVLGTILNIDWKESKSFGFNSSSLSFNQKVQIVMDIKGLEKRDLKQFHTLMNIRNKFAHVSEIKTFNDLFSLSKVGNEIKNNFLKWYFDDNGINDIPEKNHETIFRLCFYLLVDNIFKILLKVSGDHMYELGFSEGKRKASEELNQEFIKALKEIKGGKELIKMVLSKLENKELFD